ncbi:MAG: protein usg [Candidatus Pacebacteria bacterium]|nr:protein usg [Candidatus Paceibacterota bacterium]
MHDRDFQAQIKGFSLTTAELLYRLPDFPKILQVYVWQDYDLHPQFPKLRKFLDYWTINIEGKLAHVRIMHARLITPREIGFVDKEFKLN